MVIFLSYVSLPEGIKIDGNIIVINDLHSEGLKNANDP